VFPPHPNAASLDFEDLDDFLMSDRAPEDCMQLSDLDGFLTAVAIGPELIMPSEWLPVIWGEGEPEFESAEEAQSVIGAIMARYSEILSLPRFGGRFRSWVRSGIDCGIEAMPGLFPGRRRGQGSKTAERRAAGASLTAASVRKSWQHRFDARSSAATAEIDGRAWASS
jgi:hypothetical protein